MFQLLFAVWDITTIIFCNEQFRQVADIANKP